MNYLSMPYSLQTILRGVKHNIHLPKVVSGVGVDGGGARNCSLEFSIIFAARAPPPPPPTVIYFPLSAFLLQEYTYLMFLFCWNLFSILNLPYLAPPPCFLFLKFPSSFLLFYHQIQL